MFTSFGFFGDRSWIQLPALTAGFHSSVTVRNFKTLQYKRVKAIKNLKAGVWCRTCNPSKSEAEFSISVLVRKPEGKLYSFHAKKLSKHNFWET